MPVVRLAHVNLRTTRLSEMCAFYETALGFRVGRRPPFSFPGVWLYCGDAPVIHLVGVEREPPLPSELKLQHFAFDASELSAFTENLDRLSIPYRISELAGWKQPQVHLRDPDGNALHVDFPPPAAHA
jgi:catechol 2,3-dioxygenase-like lactoylglutathione lyase family enzyme